MSASSLAGRIAKLEQAVPGANGVCGCFGVGSRDIRIYDGPDSEADADRDTRPADTCETCGGERQILKVVFVKEWRGFAA